MRLVSALHLALASFLILSGFIQYSSAAPQRQQPQQHRISRNQRRQQPGQRQRMLPAGVDQLRQDPIEYHLPDTNGVFFGKRFFSAPSQQQLVRFNGGRSSSIQGVDDSPSTSDEMTLASRIDTRSVSGAVRELPETTGLFFGKRGTIRSPRSLAHDADGCGSDVRLSRPSTTNGRLQLPLQADDGAAELSSSETGPESSGDGPCVRSGSWPMLWNAKLRNDDVRRNTSGEPVESKMT
jgi:hypothetical protein